MPVKDHARMLAVAPGGWDRCMCRNCRLPESAVHLRKSARRIERRTVAAEIADALTPEADLPPLEVALDITLGSLIALDDDEGAFMVALFDGGASAVFEPYHRAGN